MARSAAALPVERELRDAFQHGQESAFDLGEAMRSGSPGGNVVLVFMAAAALAACDVIEPPDARLLPLFDIPPAWNAATSTIRVSSAASGLW